MSHKPYVSLCYIKSLTWCPALGLSCSILAVSAPFLPGVFVGATSVNLIYMGSTLSLYLTAGPEGK